MLGLKPYWQNSKGEWLNPSLRGSIWWLGGSCKDPLGQFGVHHSVWEVPGFRARALVEAAKLNSQRVNLRSPQFKGGWGGGGGAGGTESYMPL